MELPWTPEFLHKKDGFVFSMGQLMQWMSGQVLATGTVQIWPATPVAGALVDGKKVLGVRLLDQGVDRPGGPRPRTCRAWTSTRRSPWSPTARSARSGGSSTRRFGMPEGHARRDWAVGMKFVVDLPEDTPLDARHGAPHDRLPRAGDLRVPLRPPGPRRLGRHLRAELVRVAGADERTATSSTTSSTRTSGAGSRAAAPLVGREVDPASRAGAASRCSRATASPASARARARTNVLTTRASTRRSRPACSSARASSSSSRRASRSRRRTSTPPTSRGGAASWVESEGRVAEKARDGFQRGVVTGLVGMALAGLTKGKVALGEEPPHPADAIGTVEGFYAAGSPPRRSPGSARSARRRASRCTTRSWTRAGWPADPARREAARLAPGRAAHGRQGAGAGGLRRPRRLPRPELCERLRDAGLRRDLLGRGAPPGRRRRPELRPREVRPLRRLPVELHRAGRRDGRR